MCYITVNELYNCRCSGTNTVLNKTVFSPPGIVVVIPEDDVYQHRWPELLPVPPKEEVTQGSSAVLECMTDTHSAARYIKWERKGENIHVVFFTSSCLVLQCW